MGEGAAPDAVPGPVVGEAAQSSISDAAGQIEPDPAFSSFVTSSRSQLDEIDGLLNKESN